LHIKEVELKNFKSFGKSVRVPLKNDFVTVTGPNGSGKSNIVDALLFALCLSSSRAMRAERLPDLIYRGEGAKNPDFAQVTVRLDIAGRSFPLDCDTIEVSRSIKVKGDKYSSSYYFNGESCSQGELHELLAKAGFSSVDVFYAFPDYRFPDYVLSEHGMDLYRPFRYATARSRIKKIGCYLVESIVFQRLKLHGFAPALIAIARK